MAYEIAYTRPRDLTEALEFLSKNGDGSTIVAGGTDVMVDLRSGELKTRHLLDVHRLEELQGIRLEGNNLRVGAAVTLSQIRQSSLLGQYAPALKKSAENFASTQIRNVATIGGNVAHCSPCGDTVPPLVIHGARVIIASKKGQREVAVEEIATGPYQCLLGKDEMIIAFLLQPMETDFADFQKIGRRKELAISRLSLAAMANKDEQGRISLFRVSLGACTPTPNRMTAVEDFLIGKIPDAKLLFAAGRLLAEEMIEITGRRSSIIYKEPAVQGLFVRMLAPVI